MRIAIIADAHGNIDALVAVLDSIDGRGVDAVIAAGDMVVPFPGSLEVWEILRSRGIPYLRGNQEEFVLFSHGADQDDPLRQSPRFMPLQYAASLFDASQVDAMAGLPLTWSTAPSDPRGLLACHASPFDPWRSISDAVDPSLEAQFRRVGESTIVAGHHHRLWRGSWRTKSLALCGSCGLPMTGSTDASYLLAEARGTGWSLEDILVPYDRQKVVDGLVDTDFATKAGPIGWLLAADLLLADRFLMRYFAEAHASDDPHSHGEYAASVRAYLERAGVLTTVQSALDNALNDDPPLNE